MKTKLLTPSLTIAALAMISAPFAKGSVIWSDDFNQYSMGTNSSIALPIGTNSPDLRWWSANNDANRTNTVHKDSSDLFGE